MKKFKKRGEGPKRPRMTCWDRALFILSVREHSLFELEQKLNKSKYESDEIEETLSRVVDRRFQSDVRYFDARVRSLLMRRWGPQKIKMSIMQAKVPWCEERYEELREELGSGETLDEQVKALLEKKLRSSAVQKYIESANFNEYSDKAKLKEKLLRHLVSRGFGFTEALSHVNRETDMIFKQFLDNE